MLSIEEVLEQQRQAVEAERGARQQREADIKAARETAYRREMDLLRQLSARLR